MVILAGDVHLRTKGIDWIIKVSVIYVLGNYKYYKGSYPKILNSIKGLAMGRNIHVLENNSVIFGDITFHGATLWTDFALLGDSRLNGSICQGERNDYKMIHRDPPYSKLRSIDTYVMHPASLKWLRASLETAVNGKEHRCDASCTKHQADT